MGERDITVMAVPVTVCAENIVDLANYIREGCRQVDLEVTDADCLRTAGTVIAGQPVPVPDRS